jgi:hypothetical protein
LIVVVSNGQTRMRRFVGANLRCWFHKNSFVSRFVGAAGTHSGCARLQPLVAASAAPTWRDRRAFSPALGQRNLRTLFTADCVPVQWSREKPSIIPSATLRLD